VFLSWLLIGHVAGTHGGNMVDTVECTYFLAILFENIANITTARLLVLRAQGVHGIQHCVERTRRRAEGKLNTVQ